MSKKKKKDKGKGNNTDSSEISGAAACSSEVSLLILCRPVMQQHLQMTCRRNNADFSVSSNLFWCSDAVPTLCKLRQPGDCSSTEGEDVYVRYRRDM